MFQLYLCLELLFVQTISSHYMPSLMHILKMMMNAVMTLHPIAEYSTCLNPAFLNSYLSFDLLDNSTSSSYFCLCSLFYTSFSLDTH
jgi:hypothetical protein